MPQHVLLRHTSTIVGLLTLQSVCTGMHHVLLVSNDECILTKTSNAHDIQTIMLFWLHDRLWDNAVLGHESCLCLSSEAGNAGRSGVLKALGGFNNQQTVMVEGASRHLLALLQPYWQRLPTDVRPGHLSGAMHHNAIQRDLGSTSHYIDDTS